MAILDYANLLVRRYIVADQSSVAGAIDFTTCGVGAGTAFNINFSELHILDVSAIDISEQTEAVLGRTLS